MAYNNGIVICTKILTKPKSPSPCTSPSCQRCYQSLLKVSHYKSLLKVQFRSVVILLSFPSSPPLHSHYSSPVPLSRHPAVLSQFTLSHHRSPLKVQFRSAVILPTQTLVFSRLAHPTGGCKIIHKIYSQETKCEMHRKIHKTF